MNKGYEAITVRCGDDTESLVTCSGIVAWNGRSSHCDDLGNDSTMRKHDTL